MLPSSVATTIKFLYIALCFSAVPWYDLSSDCSEQQHDEGRAVAAARIGG